jgi:predicted Zn-ribbon and HTH transcriptional regulator
MALFSKKSILKRLGVVENGTPEIPGVEWVRVYDVEYNACTRCGAEWGHSIYGNESWPESVKKRVGKECKHTAPGTSDIGRVVSVDPKGEHLVLSYEKCRLCGSIHSSFYGRIADRNRCPKCQRQLGMNYSEIGYASESVFYCYERDPL